MGRPSSWPGIRGANLHRDGRRFLGPRSERRRSLGNHRFFPGSPRVRWKRKEAVSAPLTESYCRCRPVLANGQGWGRETAPPPRPPGALESGSEVGAGKDPFYTAVSRRPAIRPPLGSPVFKADTGDSQRCRRRVGGLGYGRRRGMKRSRACSKVRRKRPEERRLSARGGANSKAKRNVELAELGPAGATERKQKEDGRERKGVRLGERKQLWSTERALNFRGCLKNLGADPSRDRARFFFLFPATFSPSSSLPRFSPSTIHPSDLCVDLPRLWS